MSFITDELIITNKTEPIYSILKNGVAYFFDELNKYIEHNDDSQILNYANEITLSSLFLCGNIRQSSQITGVQEYGIDCIKGKKSFRGRPDIFMKSEKNAIWIECKFQKNTVTITNNHWDIGAWLLWDNQTILQQLQDYYEAEKKMINSSFEKHYLVTLCFKLIRENKNQHLDLVQKKLREETKKLFISEWYYQVAFEESLTEICYGLEVYGTFKEEIV